MTKDEFFDEDGEKLLQSGGFVLSVDDVALALLFKLGVRAKFAAEKFDRVWKL